MECYVLPLLNHISPVLMTEKVPLIENSQKGMTFDHDFGYSLPLFFTLLKNGGEEKQDELAKFVIKGNTFLLDPDI